MSTSGRILRVTDGSRKQLAELLAEAKASPSARSLLGTATRMDPTIAEAALAELVQALEGFTLPSETPVDAIHRLLAERGHALELAQSFSESSREWHMRAIAAEHALLRQAR